MDKTKLLKFISKQKTAFIASVNEEGYPVMRAMLSPRKIDGNEFYFSTNASSNKVKHFLENDKACIYFYHRGVISYQGVMIIGKVEVCTGQPTKDMIWRFGDQLIYRQGVTDPDYCVLKFTAQTAEYYCDLKIETVEF